MKKVTVETMVNRKMIALKSILEIFRSAENARDNEEHHRAEQLYTKAEKAVKCEAQMMKEVYNDIIYLINLISEGHTFEVKKLLTIMVKSTA